MAIDPRLYGLIHRGNPGDVAFYAASCAEADHVLELGCGQGRISLALVGLGLRVTGVDVDPEMLAHLAEAKAALKPGAQERLTTVQADMRSFSLPDKFDRVIIPYNALLCLLSEDDVVQCLTHAARHLRPGGQTIFDIFASSVGDFEGAVDDSVLEDDYDHLITVEDEGRTIDVLEKALAHADSRRCDTAYRYQIQANGTVNHVDYVIRQRCIYQEDLPEILRRVGYQHFSIRNGFSKGNTAEDDDTVVVCACHEGSPKPNPS